MAKDNKEKSSQADISINLDTTPILYTDRIGITVNPNGVMFDVMQQMGPTNKVRIVSRIGMSKTHAKKFLEELGKLLAMTEGAAQTGKKLN